jgi:hypothetical protein
MMLSCELYIFRFLQSTVIICLTRLDPGVYVVGTLKKPHVIMQ